MRKPTNITKSTKDSPRVAAENGYKYSCDCTSGTLCRESLAGDRSPVAAGRRVRRPRRRRAAHRRGGRRHVRNVGEGRSAKVQAEMAAPGTALELVRTLRTYYWMALKWQNLFPNWKCNLTPSTRVVNDYTLEQNLVLELL